MSMNEHMKPRVNASIMPNYLEQNVSLLGIAKNVDTSGNFFTLTTCDDQDVKIMLQEPLSQPVSGLTEVYGMVKSPDSVMCGDFIVIPEEAAKEFESAFPTKVIRSGDELIRGDLLSKKLKLC